MNPVLEDVYRTGKCVDSAGKERKVTGAVPREDALILQEMVRFVKAKTTLETGVAFGLSTLGPSADFADSTDSRNPDSGRGSEAKYYGVDPEQNVVHGGVVLLHDRSWPSKQKVIGFIRMHRRHKGLPVRSGESGDSPSEARIGRSPVQSPFSPTWLRRVIAAKLH